MKKSALFFACLCIAFCTSPFEAFSVPQSAEVTADVRPGKALIGLPVQYRITVRAKDVSSLQVVLPDSKEIFLVKEKSYSKKEKKEDGETDAATKVPLCIIQTAKKDTVSENGVTKLVVTLDIIYYRTGTHLLPEISVHDAQNNKLAYTVPSVIIDAANAKDEDPDIEPPLVLSGNYWRILWIILAAVTIGFAVFYSYKFIKKYAAKIRLEHMVPPLELFQNDMQSIKEKQLIQEGHIEEFVFDMSLSFRKLLSALFHFDAAEMTPDEILVSMQQCVAPVVYEKYRQELSSILSLWELAKFAEFSPSEEIMWQNVLATEAFAVRLAAEAEYVRT